MPHRRDAVSMIVREPTRHAGRRLEKQARKDLKERQQDLDRACTELEEAQEQLELQLEEGNEAPPLPGGGSQYGEQSKEERAEKSVCLEACKTQRLGDLLVML